jgi:hypothetical protein
LSVSEFSIFKTWSFESLYLFVKLFFRISKFFTSFFSILSIYCFLSLEFFQFLLYFYSIFFAVHIIYFFWKNKNRFHILIFSCLLFRQPPWQLSVQVPALSSSRTRTYTSISTSSSPTRLRDSFFPSSLPFRSLLFFVWLFLEAQIIVLRLIIKIAASAAAYQWHYLS